MAVYVFVALTVVNAVAILAIGRPFIRKFIASRVPPEPRPGDRLLTAVPFVAAAASLAMGAGLFLARDHFTA